MMRKLLFIFFFITSFSLNGQNDFKKRTDSLIALYEKNKNNDSLITLTHRASIDYYKRKDFELATYYAEKEVKLIQHSTTKTAYKNSLFNLGLFLYLNKDYYRSIKIHHKVIDSFTSDKKTHQSYFEIAKNYNKLGDFYQAETYFLNGLSDEKMLSAHDLFGNYLHLAMVYHIIETKESLKKEYLALQKADSIFKSNNFYSDTQKFKQLNNTMANHYNSEINLDFDKAKYYYNQLMEEALASKDSASLLISYNNLTHLYNKVNNDSAYYYAQKGEQLLKSGTIKTQWLYLNIADYFYRKKDYDKSNAYIQKTLQFILPNGIDSDYSHVPKFEDVTISNQKTVILSSLKSRIKNFIAEFEIDADISKIKTALENAILADKLLDVIKTESFETQSKLFWQKEASELYLLGSKLCWNLNDYDKAFYFIEKNKAILLLENVNENEMKKHANMPSSLIENEFLLKKKINYLENELDAKNSDAVNLKGDYANAKIEYRDFIASLKKKFPQYYNYKTTPEVLSLKVAQDHLDSDTVIIEYILNKKEGFVLAISKTEKAFYQINDIEHLLATIESYLSIISKPFDTQKRLEKYHQLSSEIYKTLIPFATDNIMKGKKRLLVIPDYTLQNIPFETLQTNPEKSKYLIHDYEISYAYSYSFLNKNNSIERNPSQKFIGFAPYAFEHDNLQTLPRSKIEIEEINELFDGSIFTDSLSTKQKFLSNINDYEIIHLSTHANANDSIAPWIAFKDGKLYLNELYLTQNQAELVVLSACNTSLGEISSGEGVFSLARGFFYSGSNSVVSSLWNVNDKSNQEILSGFYNYLKKGETKSSALRKAKLDYIDSHSHSEISPYYWSSLILIGDDAPIQSSYLHTYLLLAVGFILLVLIIVVLKKRKIIG